MFWKLLRFVVFTGLGRFLAVWACCKWERPDDCRCFERELEAKRARCTPASLSPLSACMYTDFVSPGHLHIFIDSHGFQLAGALMNSRRTRCRHGGLARSLRLMSQRANRDDQGCLRRPDHADQITVCSLRPANAWSVSVFVLWLESGASIRRPSDAASRPDAGSRASLWELN